MLVNLEQGQATEEKEQEHEGVDGSYGEDTADAADGQEGATKEKEGEKLLAGKYKTVDELVKGYSELSRKVREVPKAPESYNLEELGIEENDPLFMGMQDSFKAANLTQEQVKALTEKWHDIQQQDAVDLEAEKAKLGADADRTISTVQNFFAKRRNEFEQAELSAIESTLTTAESVKAMAKLIGFIQGRNIPTDTQPSAADAGNYFEKAQEIRKSPKFSASPELQKEYNNLMMQYAQIASRQNK